MIHSSKLTLALAVALVAGLSSCAGKMSKKDCEAVDYYEVGLKEGKAGKNADRIRELTETCTAEGVAIGTEKYNYGRQVGLADYCDESRAKSDVKKNITDSICMREKVPPYQTAYKAALAASREDKLKAIEKLEKAKAELLQQEEKARADLNAVDQQMIVVQ